MQAAVPLALADNLKAGINTAENLMVPRRLALNSATADPLAAFGMVSGMVFPVIMFPAAILFGLNELLIPEMARCSAAGQDRRIRYLVRKSLRAALIYGLMCSGLLFLLAQPLCCRLYGTAKAAGYMGAYALLIPMLYCDSVTDAMTKGLGQQKVCVRYNILTSALDVVFLYLLLPKYGMAGYFISFFATHLLNFILSLRRLLKITGLAVPFHLPALAASGMLISLFAASFLEQSILRIASYLLIFGSTLFLNGIVNRADIAWFKALVQKNDLTQS